MKIQNDNIPIKIVILFFILTLFKIYIYVNSSPTYSGDDQVFWDISKISISKEFFISYRPFTVPLIYKILKQNELIVVIFQIFLSIFSWFYFAFIFRRFFKIKLVYYLFFLSIILFSYSSYFSMWEMIIRSESIATSLSLLWLGLSLELIEKLKKDSSKIYKKFIFIFIWILITILWSFTRDNHPYILIFVAFFMSLALFFRRVRVKIELILYIFIILVSLGIFTLQDYSAKEGKRWMFPLINVFMQRIFTNDNKLNYFIEKGMPFTPELMQFKNQVASSFDGLIFKENFQFFRDWLEKDGLNLYKFFLITHPILSLSEVNNNFNIMLYNDISYYGPQLIKFSNKLSNFFLFRLNSWGILSIILMLIICFKVSKNYIFLFPIMLLLFAYNQAFVCYHADAIEIGRHSLIVKLFIYLSLWVGSFLIVDFCLGIIFNKLKIFSRYKEKFNNE